MSEIFQLLTLLEETSKRTEKENLLLRYSSERLRQVINYALDPRKVFYLKRFEKVEPLTSDLGYWSDEFWDLLDDLRTRRLTGNAAVQAQKNLCLHMSHENQEILRRILIKDLRCGVSTATVNKVFPNLVPVFSIMAAHGFNENKVEYPCYAEPKIDGIRAVAFINGHLPEDVVFYSRSGKEFESLNSIAEELVKVFPVGWVIDGEVKVPGTFQKSSSTILRTVNMKDNPEIFYSVFDAMTIEEFDNKKCHNEYWKRRQWFVDKIDNAKEKHIFYWTAYRCNSITDINRAYEEFRELGHEGAMIKQNNGKYEFKRSDNWMKIKPEETVDLEVIGFQKGSGKNSEILGNLLVDYKGKECSVGTGFSDELRTEIWNNQDKYLGAIAEITFTEETDDGVMRHNRFERFRTFKGEKV